MEEQLETKCSTSQNMAYNAVEDTDFSKSTIQSIIFLKLDGMLIFVSIMKLNDNEHANYCKKC